MAAVRIIAHVLNDRAAVGVSLRLAELCFGRAWKTREKKRLDVRLPSCINDGFVCKHGVGAGLAWTNERASQNANENCAEAASHKSFDAKRHGFRFNAASLFFPI